MREISMLYFKFKKGTVFCSSDDVDLSLFKGEITDITFHDLKQCKCVENPFAHIQEVLNSELEKLTVSYKAKKYSSPIDSVVYPRRLKGKNNENLLQTNNIKKSIKMKSVHITFRDYAFEVTDLKGKTIILVKDQMTFTKNKHKVYSYDTIKFLSNKFKGKIKNEKYRKNLHQ